MSPKQIYATLDPGQTLEVDQWTDKRWWYWSFVFSRVAVLLLFYYVCVFRLYVCCVLCKMN